jgi:hypothetical protein
MLESYARTPACSRYVTQSGSDTDYLIGVDPNVVRALRCCLHFDRRQAGAVELEWLLDQRWSGASVALSGEECI